jgi:peptidyl-prolyl cis-trans isomerase SurA
MEVNKKEEKPKKKKSYAFQYSAILLLFVLIVVLGFVVFGPEKISGSEIVAEINGEKIIMEELNNLYDSLPPQQKSEITKYQVLEQLIQLEVIYQEAKDRGISVSEKEAEQELDLLITSSGITKEQFLESLSLSGITEDKFNENYIIQLTIQKFLDENVLIDLKASPEEVEDYYSKNILQFERGEGVTVRHILIGDKELSVEEKESKANELLKKINKNNFCDYVEEYSTDVASIPNCGEYSFTKEDPYVQEFKDLSFSQEAGDMDVVNTQFGTHIIWTVEKKPAGTIELGEVYLQIEDFLNKQKTKERFDDYYKDLESKNDINILFERV